ncbi:MAG TPA: hypothetical protein VMF86_05070 [Stellaceae bacterium]|nr:hypothetical protein [Stellaceae bacterium]
MNATSDDIATYTARRSGLDWLLELLWKRRRKTSKAGKNKINSSETGPLRESEIYADRSPEWEVIFMSMMWF